VLAFALALAAGTALAAITLLPFRELLSHSATSTRPPSRFADAIPRFLHYSCRGHLPPSPRLTCLYLRTPIVWRVLGKQFLIFGRRPPTSVRLPYAFRPADARGSL